MSIKLTILGSGSAVPTLVRSVTSQYLNFDERQILIDCGEGTQIQLRKFKVKFQRIRFICISHLHGDHYLGLFGLLKSLSLTGRTRKLTIFSPEGLEDMVSLVMKTSQVKLRFEIEFITLSSETKKVIFEDNVMKIYCFPIRHRIETYGYLFEQKEKELKIRKESIQKYQLSVDEIKKAKAGKDIVRETSYIRNEEVTLTPGPLKSYAYCSDTNYFPNICKWIEGASLLYHEATFIEKDKERAKDTMHSTAKEAATIASKAGVDKLIMGHFSARYRTTEGLEQEAKEIFSESECVEDGNNYLL